MEERIYEVKDGIQSLLEVKDPKLKLQKEANNYLKTIVISFLRILKNNNAKDINSATKILKSILKFNNIDLFSDAEIDALNTYECFWNLEHKDNLVEVQHKCNLHFNLRNIYNYFNGVLSSDVIVYISSILEYFIFQILVSANADEKTNWVTMEDIKKVIYDDDEINIILNNIKHM